MSESIEKHHSWRVKLYAIVHATNTKQGKIFNLFLFVLIVISVIYVMLESVDSIDKKYHSIMIVAEWIITILFSI